MKKLRNSTKAFIISICVAVIAVTGILTAVILGNKKNGGGTPPKDEGGSNIAYSYALTEEQKKLVADINAQRKESILAEKGETLQVLKSDFVDAGIVMGDVIFFDGERCVTLYNDNYNAYILENGDFVSLQTYLIRNEMIHANATKFKYVSYYDGFLLISYEYKENQDTFVDYHVVSFDNEIKISKTFHLLKDEEVLLIDDMVSVFIRPFRKFFTVNYSNGYEYTYDICFYEYLNDYTGYDYGYIIRDNIVQLGEEEFGLEKIKSYYFEGDTGLAVEYKNEEKEIVRYSEDVGFYRYFLEEEDLGYSYRSHGLNIIENVVKGEVDDYSVLVEEENNGYYANYSYQIKFGEEEFKDLELDKRYAKITPVFASDNYFGLCCQNVDSENNLLSDSTYYYFDYDMNLVVKYYSETENAAIMFSDGFKLFTDDGIYASEALVETNCVVNFEELNMYVVSVDYSLGCYVVKNTTDSYVVSVDDLLFHYEDGLNNVYVVDTDLYLLEDEGNFSLFDAASNTKSPVVLNALTELNFLLLENYGIYFVNNSTGYDIHVGRDVVYKDVVVEAYGLNYLRFKQNAKDYYLYLDGEELYEFKLESDNYSLENQTPEIENYTDIADGLISYTTSGKDTITIKYKKGVYPSVKESLYIQFNRSNTDGNDYLLRMPIWVSVSNGQASAKSGDIELLNTVNDAVVERDATIGDYDYGKLTFETHYITVWVPFKTVKVPIEVPGLWLYYQESVSMASGYPKLTVDSDCITVTYKFKDNSTEGNVLNGLSLYFWGSKETEYKNKNSSAASELYYKLTSYYVNSINADFATLLTKELKDNDTYDVVTTNTIKFGTTEHVVTNELSDSNNISVIKGATLKGYTKPDASSTQAKGVSDIYNSSYDSRSNKISASHSVTKKPLRTGTFGYYLNISDNKSYLFSQGKLNTTRYIYPVYAPNEITVNVDYGKNILSAELPTFDIYKTDSKGGNKSQVDKSNDKLILANKTYSFKITYARYFTLSAETTHYSLTGWKVTNSSINGDKSVSNVFTKVDTADTSINIEAIWDEKTYHIKAYVYTPTSDKFFNGYIFNEDTGKIDIANKQKLLEDPNVVPLYYASNYPSGKNELGSNTSSGLLGVTLKTFKYVETEDDTALTLADFFTGSRGDDYKIDDIYKNIIAASDYEFYAWAYCLPDGNKNVNKNITDSAFAYNCSTKVFDSLICADSTIYLMAIYKEKIYTISVDSQPIGGSLSNTFDVKGDTPFVGGTGSEEDSSTVNNFYNYAMIKPEYTFVINKKVSTGSQNTQSIRSFYSEYGETGTLLDNNGTNNTGEDIRVKNNIEMIVSVKSSYYTYKFEITNLVFKYRSSSDTAYKYYSVNVTLTYNRTEWTVTHTKTDEFKYDEDSGRFSKYDENILKITKVDSSGDNTFKITIDKLANPSENVVNGTNTISGEAGFTIKMYVDSLTAIDNDIIIHDSSITDSTTLEKNKYNNIAYEYGTQSLVVDNAAKSAYFWYAGRKQFLYHKYTGSVDIKEGFYKTSSSTSKSYNYISSSGTITRDNFLTTKSTNSQVNVYLQKSGDNWIIFYPQVQYNGVKNGAVSSSTYLDFDVDITNAPNKSTGLISFNNTRLVAFDPYQSKVNLSKDPSDYNLSNYYELKSYITSIVIGNQVLFNFGKPTRELDNTNLYADNSSVFTSGNSAYVQDYFLLNVTGSKAERIIEGNDLQGKIFKYLGDDYIIHDAYKSTYMSAVYYLYMARRASDNYTMYFLLYDNHRNDGTTTLAYSSSDEIVLKVSNLDYSINFSTESGRSNVDSYASGVETKFTLYNDNSQKLFNGTNYEFRDGNKQKITYNSKNISRTVNASVNNVFALVPNDGYFIQSFKLSIGDTVIYSFVLNDDSFNNIIRSDNGDYLYTYTDVESGTVPLITYNVEYGNVVHSDLYKLSGVTNYDNNRSTRFGVYFDNFGTNNWNTFNLSSTTYQFNYLFFMVAGIYDDIDIEFEIVSYAEFVFELSDDVATEILSGISPDTTNGIYSDYTTKFEDLNINFYAYKSSSKTTSNMQGKSELNSGEGKIVVKFADSSGNGILKNTLRVIFLGKADLIKNGVYVSGSNTDYSYYFTDGRFYFSSSGSYEFPEGKSFTDPFKCLSDYSGRNANGSSFDNFADLDYSDKLVYLGLGTASGKSLRSFFNNYTISKYATEINTIKDMERSCKYMLAVKVQRNTVNAVVNSYLYNDNLVSGNIGFTNVYAHSSTNDYKYHITSTGNKIFFLDTNATNADRAEAYQLDNSATKEQSWFNNVVLSNININNAGSNKNWQELVSGLDSNSNRFSINGYGITYDYYEIPGYYLNYVCIYIKEHGLVIFNIPNLVPKTGTIEINKDLSIGGSAHDKVHYAFHIKYDADAAKFTFKIYRNSSGVNAKKDDFFSAGILANDIEISFLSNSYNYAVHYNYFADDDENKFSSYSLKQMSGVSNTGTAARPIYVQNIKYDTMSILNPTASMPGYTFIGWGSKMYYDDVYKQYYNRQNYSESTGLNTWNSTSSWFNVADNTYLNYFAFNNRDAFIGDTNSLLADYYSAFAYPGTAFYVARSYFVTDRGDTETENYNFWINYISNFTATIGNYLTYTQTETSYRIYNDAYVDKRNIDLYGVWKANTYAISFNLNSLEDHDSTVYLDFDANDAFATTLLTSKLGFERNSIKYYAYVTFDTNLWYITTDSNFSYTSEYAMLAENNMLKLIVDRYGYTWLGWYNVKQDAELREATYDFSTLSASFASKYYNQKNNIDKSLQNIPKFDKAFYDANGIDDSEFETNPFVYYDKNYNSKADDMKIYYYCYSNIGSVLPEIGGDSNSISTVKYNQTTDYLNKTDFFESGRLYRGFGNPFSVVTYYDTSLANNCYKTVLNPGNDDNSYASVEITKDGTMRMITLYAYWQTNKYKVIYDWQDKEQTDDATGDPLYSSLNHLGSTVSTDASIQSAQDPDGTANYYYFNDTDLDVALRALTPKRVGYDFIGWTFNYIPENSTDFNYEISGINVMNSVNTPSSVYYLNSQMMLKYNTLKAAFDSTIPNSAAVLFTNGDLVKNYDINDIDATNWILNYDTYEDDGIKYNNYSEQLGGDDLLEGHFVYIFALWKPQTFSINVSLNIQQEQLENLYELDSDFAISLYNGAFGNRTSTSIGVNSGYYLYDAGNFNEIVANVAFEIEFDTEFSTASMVIEGQTYNLTDFFATSAGYYFMGLMFENTYNADTNNYLFLNTLHSVLGESGLVNENYAGDVYYHNKFVQEDDYNPVFNFDYYNILFYSHHKIYNDGNDLNNIFSEANYKFLQNLDKPGASTNFGYLDTADVSGYDDLYISSEYYDGEGDPTSAGYYLYVTINGTKYYVVYYEYNSDSAGGYRKDTITFDKTFLYYNIDGKQYKIHFALNENKINDNSISEFLKYNAYYVTENFTEKRVDLTLRIALYTDRTNVLKEKTENDKATVDHGLISYSASGGVNSDYRDGSIALNGSSITFKLKTMTTRQITLYAHWKNKIIDINLINGSAGTDAAQNSNNNYGLSGYYYVEDLTFDRTNTKYEANNLHESELEFNDNGNSYFETTTELTNKDTISMNYYDTAEFLVMPYFNGRYLSEITFTFDDVLETKNAGKDTSIFVLLKRTFTVKFAFDSSTKKLTIKSVSSNFAIPNNASTPTLSTGVETDTYIDQYFTNETLLSIIDQYSLAYNLQAENDFSGYGFRISKYIEKYYDATDPNCNESGYVDVFEKGRTNINPVRFKLNNIMSSVDINCKFSVQTFEVKLYSVKNDAGSEFKKIEYEETINNQKKMMDDYYYAPAYSALETFINDSNKNTNNLMTLGPAYISSSGYNRTNIATIKTDCSDVTSTTYNVPYGYYLYGMSFNSNQAPNRPIDNYNFYPFYNADPNRSEYEQQNDKNRFYGFHYIYSLGNYNMGETDTILVPENIASYSTSEYYSRQNSAALGSISLGQSDGIRLTNLASYAFSGWYELTGKSVTVEGVDCLLLNQYSYLDEASYLCRNLELYGYYYNADKSTSVSFYYWDNDAQKYVVYGENKDIYTLENEIEGSGYTVHDVEKVITLDSEHSDIERFTTYNSTNVSLFLTNTSFGANLGGEGFEGAKYSSKEFNIEDDVEKAFINSIVDTYWYYKTTIRLIYFEDDEGYRYFAREVDSAEAGGEVVTGVKFAFVKEGTDNVLYNFAPDNSYDPQYYVRITYQEIDEVQGYYVDGDWVKNLKAGVALYTLDKEPIAAGTIYPGKVDGLYKYEKITSFAATDWVDGKWAGSEVIYNESKHPIEQGTEFISDENYYKFVQYLYNDEDWQVSFKYGAVNSRITLKLLEGPKQGTYSDNIADNLIRYTYNVNDWMNLRLRDDVSLFYKAGNDYVKVANYTAFDTYPNYFVKQDYVLSDSDWTWAVKNIELYDSNKRPLAAGEDYDENKSYFIREAYNFELNKDDWQRSYISSKLLFDENKQGLPIGTIYNSSNVYYSLAEYKYADNMSDWTKLLRSGLDLYYKNDDDSITKVTEYIDGKTTYLLQEYDDMSNSVDWGEDTLFVGGKLLYDSSLNLVKAGDQYNGKTYYELAEYTTTESDWEITLNEGVSLYNEFGQLINGVVIYNSATTYYVFVEYVDDPNDWASVLKTGKQVYDELGTILPAGSAYDSAKEYFTFKPYVKNDSDLIRKLKQDILIYVQSENSDIYTLLGTGAEYDSSKSYFLFDAYINDASDWYNTLNDNVILFFDNGEIVPFNHVYDSSRDYYIFSSFIYDFTGADLYMLYDYKYYKITEVSSFDKFHGKARYTFEIRNQKYYLVYAGNDGSGSTAWYVENGSGDLVKYTDASSRNITILKNYFVIYDNKYYPIKYPEFRDMNGTGSVYYLPTEYYAQNTKEESKPYMVTVDIEGKTLFLDYVNGRLYLEEQMINLAPIDTYKLYTPLNENFTVNLTKSSNANDSVSYITVKSVNLTKLPNINSTELYNNEEYGFVTYIRLDKTIIADGFAKLNALEQDGIYSTFYNYIVNNYYVILPEDTEEIREQKTKMLNEMLKTLNNNITLYVNSNEIFNSFMLPVSYIYDDSKNYIEKVRVSIPVKFRFDSYTYLNNQPTSIDSFYLTLLCEYQFDVINDRTEIKSELYAIPLFAPHVIKFDKDSFDYAGKEDNENLGGDVGGGGEVTPENPTDPETPTVDPEEPVDPEGGEDPETPVNPETPVDPETPTEPQEPVDPEGGEDPEGGDEPAVEPAVANGVTQSENSTNVQIYTDKMQAYFYEVTSEYSKLYTEENGNYLNFVVLNARQYAFLIDDMYRDKASNLTILLDQGLKVYNNELVDGGVGDPTVPDIAEIGIPIIEDTSRLGQDGSYYIVAFYYREGQLNVVRVGDNVIEVIVKYSGGYKIEGHNILDI